MLRMYRKIGRTHRKIDRTYRKIERIWLGQISRSFKNTQYLPSTCCRSMDIRSAMHILSTRNYSNTF
jgi:hypothetical protein